jgi:hypothetical protein
MRDNLQYGRLLSHEMPLFWHVKQSSAAPVAVNRLLRLRMLEGCVVVLAVGVSTGLVVVGAIMLSRYTFVMNYKIVSECGKAICSIELGLREGKRDTTRGQEFNDQIWRRDVDI